MVQALPGRHYSGIHAALSGLVFPWLPRPRAALHGFAVTLCPGLAWGCPFRAKSLLAEAMLSRVRSRTCRGPPFGECSPALPLEVHPVDFLGIATYREDSGSLPISIAAPILCISGHDMARRKCWKPAMSPLVDGSLQGYR